MGLTRKPFNWPHDWFGCGLKIVLTENWLEQGQVSWFWWKSVNHIGSSGVVGSWCNDVSVFKLTHYCINVSTIC